MRTDIAENLMNDLQRDFGLTREQAAGVVGNLAHESMGFMELQEMNPTVRGSRGGYGYAQWTGPRRNEFENYTRERGLRPDSYQANYGFLAHELRTTEKRSLAALRETRTVEQATRVFENKFERAGIKHMSGRIAAANSVYSTFNARPVTAGGPLAPLPSQAPRNANAFAGTPAQRGAPAAIGGLLAGQPRNVPTPTASPRRAETANVPTPSSARMAAPSNPSAPQGLLDRYASTRPTPNSPVSAPPTTREARALTPAQEENLAGRLGPVEAPRTATTIGGLLGVTPAAAATMTPELARANQQAQTATAPARQTRSVGSPRALEALGAPPLDPVQQALAPLASRDVPTRQVASVPGPVAPTQQAPSFSPAISAPTPQSYTAPAAAMGGAGYASGLPSAPAAPSRGLLSGINDWAGNNRGMVTGGLLGGALAGPVGLIAGGLLGRAFQTPDIGGGEASPSAAAQAALNAGWAGFGPMSAAQERAAYSAMGGSSRDNSPSQAAQDAARSGKAGGLF